MPPLPQCVCVAMVAEPLLPTCTQRRQNMPGHANGTRQAMASAWTGGEAGAPLCVVPPLPASRTHPTQCQRMAGAEAATAHPHQPMCTDPGGNEWVERAPVGWPGVNCAYPAHAQIIPPFRLPRPLTHAVRVVAARAYCKQRAGCYQFTLLIHRGASEPTRTWKGGMRTSHRRGRPKKPDVWPQNPRSGPLCVVPRGHSAG